MSKPVKRPLHWPDNVEYLTQSHLAPRFPPSLHLFIISPGSASRNVQKVPVVIKLIKDPQHPAYGQRGLFARSKIAPNSYIISYFGEIHCDERLESDYDLSLDHFDCTNLGIDASRKGNEARFINDFRGIKSKPNAVFRQGRDNRGWLEMSVWTGPVPVKKGEEILVSYGKGWWAARTSIEIGNAEEANYDKENRA